MAKVKVIHPKTGAVVEVNYPSLEASKWEWEATAKARKDAEAEIAKIKADSVKAKAPEAKK